MLTRVCVCRVSAPNAEALNVMVDIILGGSSPFRTHFHS